MTDMSTGATPVAFSVGRVLSRAFEVLSRNLGKFIVITVIAWSPYLVLLLVLQSFPSAPRTGVGAGGFAALSAGAILTFILQAVLRVISQAVILYGTFQDMRGQSFDIADSFEKGLSRFFPILGLIICAGIATGFAFLFFIIPGLILATMWYVALPICVVEQLGPFASMSRSAALTKGNRWEVFGILLLLGLAALIIGAIIGFVLALIGGGFAVAIGSFLWQAVFSAYSSIVVAVAYYGLRASKEGIDIERMAAVFD